jgi:ferredoxin
VRKVPYRLHWSPRVLPWPSPPPGRRGYQENWNLVHASISLRFPVYDVKFIEKQDAQVTGQLVDRDSERCGACREICYAALLLPLQPWLGCVEERDFILLYSRRLDSTYSLGRALCSLCGYEAHPVPGFQSFPLPVAPLPRSPG